jgi:hypothetical protein
MKITINLDNLSIGDLELLEEFGEQSDAAREAQAKLKILNTQKKELETSGREVSQDLLNQIESVKKQTKLGVKMRDFIPLMDRAVEGGVRKLPLSQLGAIMQALSQAITEAAESTDPDSPLGS